jgi:hypothetical protein
MYILMSRRRDNEMDVNQPETIRCNSINSELDGPDGECGGGLQQSGGPQKEKKRHRRNSASGFRLCLSFASFTQSRTPTLTCAN